MEIVSVRFRSEGKQYYFDPQGISCRAGDELIVETASGLEYATCVRANFDLEDERVPSPLRPVARLATESDRATLRRNREKEEYAFRVCQEKIAEHGLEMKLVGVECTFEGTKILFFFTSEGRVDFRALVKSLAAIFHTRIELRQIGIRDEAKLLGGLGVCGRPFCCASFLKDFQPVSIKMAKTQNLSLNPAKISGTCGRLMCCLNYEQNAYEDLMKTSPRADSFVETPDGAGTIISVNTLRETCRIRLDSAPDTLNTYHNSELRVVRSGKGKRPEGYVEPPKSELAKLRKTPEEPLSGAASLTAALDDYMAAQEEPEEAPPAASHRRRHRGGRGKKSQQQQAQQAASHQTPPARNTTGKSKSGGRSRWRRRGGGHRKPPAEG